MTELERSRPTGRMLLLVTTLVITAGSCGGGTSGGSITTPTPVVLAVAAKYGATSLNVGQSTDYTLSALYSDGTVVSCSTTATWQSSDAAVATITNSGHLTALGLGNSEITASCSGVSTTFRVSVVPPSIPADAIACQSGSVTGQHVVGATLSFRETYLYTLVSAASGRVTYQISDQTGRLLGSNPTVDVSGGTGQTVTLTDAITVPAGATRICTSATLDMSTGQRLSASGACGAIQ